MHDYNELHLFDAETFKEETLDDVICSLLSCNKISTKRKEPEYSLLQPIFNWLPITLIKKTFQLSTQHDRTSASSLLKNAYRLPFPAFNVKRWSEPVATCTMHSDSPAVNDRSTCAQLFVGTNTIVIDVYGMKTDKQFVNTL